MNFQCCFKCPNWWVWVDWDSLVVITIVVWIQDLSDTIDKNAYMLGGCARNILTRMIGGISMVKY